MARRRSQHDGAALDDIDRAIVARLQIDGRLPYSKLGPAVGLSEAAVRQRVQRLKESGLMQVVAVTDPLVLRDSVMAMVGLRVQGDSRQVAEQLSALPESIYVVAVSGAFDVIVEIVCDSREELLTVLNEKIRAVPGVTGTESFMYLSLYKHTFAYGT
jgi:Lrp/AsnC family transcriptional regulator, regulator for asnA, asnC and gidA